MSWYDNASQGEREAFLNNVRGTGQGILNIPYAITANSSQSFTIQSNASTSVTNNVFTVDTSTTNPEVGLNIKPGQIGSGLTLSLTGGNTSEKLVFNTKGSTFITPQTPISGATNAPLVLVASTASQALMSVQGVFISTASINVSQAQSAFIIPIYHASQGVWGYISASKGVV